jgi:hypothetical protein
MEEASLVKKHYLVLLILVGVVAWITCYILLVFEEETKATTQYIQSNSSQLLDKNSWQVKGDGRQAMLLDRVIKEEGV